ncbi:MAG: PEPxxWA-CTERM sorting domain-containing protein [Phenylobacterium sp.]
MKKLLLAGIALAAVMAAGGASANTYNFLVDYSGGGIATLGAGSDDMLATTLNPGDSFTYTLTATGTGVWNSIADGDLFPLLALDISEAGARTGDLTVDLNFGATTVFTYSENGATNQFVHLGTNTVHLPSGLSWNQWVLSDTIQAGSDPATPSSLLPWPGNAPENHFADNITFSGGAVPEPTTWALMIGGFGMMGGALRRRRTSVAATA